MTDPGMVHHHTVLNSVCVYYLTKVRTFMRKLTNKRTPMSVINLGVYEKYYA